MNYIRFGGIHGHKPYKFIWFGGIHGPKPYKFIGFGGIHGPKPYKFIWFGGIHPTGTRLVCYGCLVLGAVGCHQTL